MSLRSATGSSPMRQETELFEDGQRTVRSYDASDRLSCIERFAASGTLQVAIDYLYDAAGINVERVVRDSSGNVLRRMQFDAAGNEVLAAESGPVRWASLDGADAGLDPRGLEQVGEQDH